MTKLVNRAKMSTSSTGTGSPITLGTAESGYQSFADAGVADGEVVRYVIEDGTDWEIGTGTYTASGTTLTRTVDESSNADAALNLTGSAVVYVSAAAADIPPVLELYAENPSSPTAPSATGTNAVAIGSGADAFDTDGISFGTDTKAGSRGVSVGPRAGMSSVSGATANVAIGWNAALYLTTGDENVAIGRSALQANLTAALTGSDNVGVGYGAGSKFSSGNANAMVGLNAGNAITSGSNNTFIGNNSDGNASLSGQTGIGYNSATSGENATALTNSYASGTDSLAAAIANNTSSYGATGANSVAIGKQAKASGLESTSVGGTSALSTGQRSVVLGGDLSEATGNLSYAYGWRARSNINSKSAYGVFVGFAVGEAQGGYIPLAASTTDATPKVLVSDGSAADTDNQIILPNNSAYAFHGTIVARQQASQGTASAAWKIEGLIRREGSAGTTVLVNSATTVIDNTPGWGLALSADTTNGGLKIEVTGAAATNIRWVATIHTSEVTY